MLNKYLLSFINKNIYGIKRMKLFCTVEHKQVIIVKLCAFQDQERKYSSWPWIWFRNLDEPWEKHGADLVAHCLHECMNYAFVIFMIIGCNIPFQHKAMPDHMKSNPNKINDEMGIRPTVLKDEAMQSLIKSKKKWIVKTIVQYWVRMTWKGLNYFKHGNL